MQFWNVQTFIVFLLALEQCYAVKDYLFKKCGQSGFCNRNRHFASEVEKLGDGYNSHYSVDISSLDIDDANGIVKGVLLKQLNDGNFVDLNFNITLINNYDLRLRIDEANREKKIGKNVTSVVTKKRYDEAPKWSFADGSNIKTNSFKHTLGSDKLTLVYGDHYKADVVLYPFQIYMYLNEELQLVVNAQNFLNVEHYRTKESEEDENSNDVAQEESKFNAYNDDFKDSKDDTLPLGPESVALDFTYQNFTSVYGIPEHADSLSLKDTTDGEPYRLYNVDIFEYPVEQKYAMYGAIPFMMSVNRNAAVGIFWVNSADTYIDIRKRTAEQQSNDTEKLVDALKSSEQVVDKVQTHWMSENGVLDVVLFVKQTPAEVSKAYGSLTGYSAIPNIFSLGYHQSRWNYNDQNDVLDVSTHLDEEQMPCDAIWLDIEYTDSKKYFTWDPHAFPNPEQMAATLNKTGRNLVVIIDPHLKTGYEVSEGVIKDKIGIMRSDLKEIYKGQCWPGESVWIDTLNPSSNKYWDEQFANGTKLLGYSTNIYLWNDMNEPSVFDGPETSGPKDLIHYGNWEHRSVHNLYGLTFHEATYRALVARNPNLRPFILTRSFFAGSQRTATMWTGDNTARWEYLRESIRMILTLNIAGFPFAGSDVGGFFQNPDKKLLTRWYQTGIWYPFFRAHSHIDSRRREPYLAEEPYRSYISDALKLRYKLLPIFYTLFHQTSISGSPVLKPMFYEYPSNGETYSIDDQFFLSDLLVKPVMEQDLNIVKMYLPDDKKYYNFFNLDNVLQGKGYHYNISAEINEIPVFLREGSILPTKQRYRRSTKLMRYDPYTLYVTLDSAAKSASGELYIDDGESFGYRDSDDFLLLNFTVENGDTISSKVIAGSSSKPFTASLSEVKVEKIIIAGAESEQREDAEIRQDGNTWTSEIEKENDSTVLSIRNPAIAINKEWVIKF